MATLENRFSWSFSAASDFDGCRRKRYWSKYAFWGGWNAHATELQRTAYRLSKMDNIYSLQGQAAEEAVMWVLRQYQDGTSVTVDQAYETVVRPFLRRKWTESKRGEWRANPKRFCCLREHYYKSWDADTERMRAEAMVTHTRTCIQQFIERMLSRLAHIDRSNEVAIATPAQGGDPESFVYNDIKIYAIPDYVYQLDGVMHIHDWKAGKVKPEHADQLALYGLWGHEKHGVEPDHICCYVEYLTTGQFAPVEFSEEAMSRVVERISESVGDMKLYLVGEDLKKNVPVPCEEWDLTAEPYLCGMCNFYELCKPELE